MHANEMDPDAMRLWSLALEFTEKLNVNRDMLANLRKQAEELKISAKGIGESYKVRRYNVDVTKEPFESELERNNVSLVMENHALLFENRQLDSLLKEYEQAMQTVMAKVRHHTQVTSQHESSLQKHYDSLLAAQEIEHSSGSRENGQGNDFGNPNKNFQHSVARLKNLLKLALHSQYVTIPDDDSDTAASISPLGSMGLEEALAKLGISTEGDDGEDEKPAKEEEEEKGAGTEEVAEARSDPEHKHDLEQQPDRTFGDTTAPNDALTGAHFPTTVPATTTTEDPNRLDWLHEREHEIARLQSENDALRLALSISPSSPGSAFLFASPSSSSLSEFGQGRSIYGEENAGTLKRMMHAKRDSVVSSPGVGFGNGMGAGAGMGGNGMNGNGMGGGGAVRGGEEGMMMRHFRDYSPPEDGQQPLSVQDQSQANGSPSSSSASANGNGNGAGTIRPPPLQRDLRKPPPLRGLTSIRPSSPLGLYRNISLPSTGVGTIGIGSGGEVGRK